MNWEMSCSIALVFNQRLKAINNLSTSGKEVEK